MRRFKCVWNMTEKTNIQQGVWGLRERTRDNQVTGSVPRLQSKMPETLDVIHEVRSVAACRSSGERERPR
jgi:hypothetical protein